MEKACAVAATSLLSLPMHEKQTIIDNFGYEPDEVINTGLPRWDVLKGYILRETVRSLIMPTWRKLA